MIFIFLFLSLLFHNAYSLELPCSNLENTVKTLVTKKVTEQYSMIKFNKLDIKLNGTVLPTDCHHATLEFPKQINLNKPLVVKIDVYNKNNAFNKRVTKIINFKGSALVYKTSKTVFNNTLLTPSTLYLDTLNINDLNNRMISTLEHLKKHEFRTHVDKGHVLETWMIKKIPDIKKGNSIDVVYKKRNITLTLGAIVLESGSIGDQVSFKLNKNKKILSGTIYDKKTIITSNI